MKKIILCLCLLFCFSPLFAFAQTDKNETRYLPILMYHSVTEYGKSEYIITPTQLESDLRFLTENGYKTVSARQLYDYVDGGGELPEKPILLTFDDGHYNNLSAALPLLEKYDCRAIVSVIGKFCEYASTSGESHHPEYSYLTWDDIKELNKSGRVEIGCHTYNMHNYSPRFGIGRIKGEDDETYLRNLTNDTTRILDKLNECHVECTVFAYPFGRYNTLAQNKLISMGFRMTLTCSEGINRVEKGNPKSLIHLKRYNRASSRTTSEVFAALRK